MNTKRIGAPRKGTLTNEQTLRLYERGVSVLVIAVREGMTVHGVLIRIERARTARRGGLSAMRGGASKRARPQPVYESFDALRAAIDELERLERPRRRRRLSAVA